MVRQWAPGPARPSYWILNTGYWILDTGYFWWLNFVALTLSAGAVHQRGYRHMEQASILAPRIPLAQPLALRLAAAWLRSENWLPSGVPARPQSHRSGEPHREGHVSRRRHSPSLRCFRSAAAHVSPTADSPGTTLADRLAATLEAGRRGAGQRHDAASPRRGADLR